MTDVTDSTLRAAARALRTVVAPALNSDNAIAHEQLRLAIEYIEFAATRAAMIGDRARFEFNHYLALAQALEPHAITASERVRNALSEALDDAKKLKPAASTKHIAGITAALTRSIRLLVREAAHFDLPPRAIIERTVLKSSAELIAFERAWYHPLGFDPSPPDIEPLNFNS